MTWETHSRNRKNKGDVSHRNFVHWLFELSLYLFQLGNNTIQFQYGKLTTCTSTSSTLITTLGSTWRINALLVFLFTRKCFLTSDDLIRQGTIWKVLSLYFASRRKNRPRPVSSQVRTLQLDERVLKSQRNVSQQIGFQVEKTSQQPASDVRHKKDFFHMSLSNKVIHF